MQNNSKIKINSNRSFGIVFFFVFLIISLWPLLYENTLRVWSIIVAMIFLILGLINSNFLTPLNKLWFKFGKILGSVVAPVVMVVIFFLVITPTGFIMKILGKDLLSKKYNSNMKSYWINREKSQRTMKQQF